MKKVILFLMFLGILNANPLDLVFKDQNATIVILDLKKDKFYFYNKLRAKTPYLPASTFKIYNSLIGLSTGVVKNVDEVFFKYSGEKVFLPTWAKDESLRSAIKVSNLVAYKALARKIGLKNMQENIKKLSYGNEKIGTKVDEFWLKGPLEISAFDQVKLLKKLVELKLPFKKQYQKEVIDILELDKNNKYTLSGKTGLYIDKNIKMGWFVGFVKTKGDTFIFALNMDMKKDQDLKIRQELALSALKAIKAI